jgi:hypothetical protein
MLDDRLFKIGDPALSPQNPWKFEGYAEYREWGSIRGEANRSGGLKRDVQNGLLKSILRASK